MALPSDNVTTGALALGSPIVGQFVALLSAMDPVFVSILLFFVGKAADIVVRIYLSRRKK